MRGHGRLDGERRVVVGSEVLVARRAVVVATGSSATIPRRRGPRGGEALDEHRGDDGEAGAGKAVRPRRRRGRRRDGAGLVVARLPRDARPPRAAADRAGGAVRERPGRVSPPRGRRRRAARDDGVLGRAERCGARRARRRRHGRSRRDPRRDRTDAADGRPRPRDGRSRSGKARAGGRVAPRSRARTGSTPSATSTDARCSRTWGSTRPGSPPTRSSARRFASARTAAPRRA